VARPVLWLMVIAFAVSAGLHAADRRDPVLTGSASLDPGRAGTLRPAANHRLLSITSGWGLRCEAKPAEGGGPLVHRLDAIGRVDCSATSSKVAVTGYEFPSIDVLRADLQDARMVLNQDARRPLSGDCADGYGDTNWSTRGGRREGSLLCGVAGNDWRMYWSDDKSRQRFVAHSTDLGALQRWWSAHVRPIEGFPTSAERDLIDVVRVAVRGRCRRDPEFPSPMAIAQIRCELGDKADYAMFAKLGSLRDTRAAIQRYADAYADGTSYDGSRQTYLRGGVTTYSLWRSSPDKRKRGDLLQFTIHGSTYLAWTNERVRLFAIVGRADQDSAKTFAAYEVAGLAGLN
jgi:hypothetical protein